jgi:hypothetical protein
MNPFTPIPTPYQLFDVMGEWVRVITRYPSGSLVIAKIERIRAEELVICPLAEG